MGSKFRTPFPEEEPLNEVEIATLVAKMADLILAATEDPGEQEQIVNDLGDVLEGWNTSFPIIPHPPLTVVLEEIFNGSAKKAQRDLGNGKRKRERE